jgi:predicted aldo/keto reductase-like oxidoreductase
MKYRKMPKSNDRLSALGFGCMRFPTTPEGKIDEDQSFAMLHAAYQGGVNYFDTAWGYHGEDSEPFVGRFLQQINRKQVYVATKLPCWLIKTREDMDEYLNKQLERLQTDYIDYYLLHALSKRTWKTVKDLGVLDFLKKAKADGKIRHIGFSFHDDYATFSRILRAFDWDFTQIMLNYLDTHYQAGIKGLKLAASRKVGVVSMEPLRGGKLVHSLPPEVETVWQKAGNHQSPLERAVAWVWNIKECSVLLSGMSTIQQVQQNIKLANKSKPETLSAKDLRTYSRARKAYLARVPYLCSECRYCMPCPLGVNIPAVLGLYAEARMFGDAPLNKKEYTMFISEEARAAQCSHCGACLPKCPQHIEIPHWMSEIKDFYAD